MNEEPAPTYRGTLRRLFRLRLVTLLAIVIPIAITSLWVRTKLDERPIDWETYSKGRFSNHIDQGQIILVYFAADWSLEGSIVEKQSFDALRIRRLVRTQGVVAMKADLTKQRQETLDAMDSNGIQFIPAVAVYSPGWPGNPAVLHGWFKEPELFGALTKATRRR